MWFRRWCAGFVGSLRRRILKKQEDSVEHHVVRHRQETAWISDAVVDPILFIVPRHAKISCAVCPDFLDIISRKFSTVYVCRTTVSPLTGVVLRSKMKARQCYSSRYRTFLHDSEQEILAG